MSYKPLKNKKITVVGAERSGVAAALFLKTQGNDVFLTELKPKENIKENISELEPAGIKAEFGGHTAQALNAGVIVISPGVPSNAPLIHEAIEKNIPVISEIEVGYQFFPKPIIAITGTNGKTTTTAMTGHLFEVAGKKPLVAGNIGDAFTGTYKEWNSVDYGVLEISSFQLDHVDSFKPKISMLLNITPDHLDRYKTYNHYIQSKFRITEQQAEKDIFIYNADSEVIAPFINMTKAQKWPFSIEKPLHFGAWVENEQFMVQLNGKAEEIMKTSDMFIKGKHNQYNALAAILAAKAEGISNDKIAEGLKSFKGVAHRIEFVREINGVPFYNDSKATNVDSLKWALGSFSSPIVLIAGGRDYGKNSYEDIESLIEENVKLIVTIGEAAEKIEHDLGKFVKVIHAKSLKESIEIAKENAVQKDIVLFSPACKSFDMFKDYVDRGNQFKDIVNGL